MRQSLAALEGQRISVKALFQARSTVVNRTNSRKVIRKMCFQYVKRNGYHIAEHVWVTVPDTVARQPLARGTWVEFDAKVVRYFKPRMSGTWHDFTLADVVNFRKAHEEKRDA